MENDILVAYASKYGATAEIAQRVGEVLRDYGLITNVIPADQVDALDSYRAVVLGSAVYAGQWRKEAVSLLEQNEQLLTARPVWFFSSGPTGEGDASALMNGWLFPEAQQPIADRIRPRGIAFFHGAIDIKKLGFAERLIVKGLKAPVGDFRDWDAIAAWATEIGKQLKREN